MEVKILLPFLIYWTLICLGKWHGIVLAVGSQQRLVRNVSTNETDQNTILRSGNKDLADLGTFRIIGGREAPAHSWPWQLALFLNTIPTCGGAILSPIWVITATHCFLRSNKPAEWTVIAGKHNIKNMNENGQQVAKISNIFTNQRYDTKTKVNDVALLKLEKPLQFNDFVKPIEIWMGLLKPDMKCTVTGWGSTKESGQKAEVLQEVDVTVFSQETCGQYYGGQFLPSSMLCAGEPKGGVDACQGDSGGPLSCFTGSRYELAGVVSWGVGCGRASKPGVYTSVQTQIDWITDIVAGQEMSPSCGEAPIASCRLNSANAAITVSNEGQEQVLEVSEACPYSWPWQVSLQASGQHICSGTLIHQSWVLVARHCNIANWYTVELGLHDLGFMSQQSITVKKVFDLNHDNRFPPSTDLTLLQLSQPAQMSDLVFPICLPGQNQEPDSSWSCVTTGWGSTKATEGVNPNRLHQSKLELMSRTTCREKWDWSLVLDTHLCTDAAGSVTCMGDSGSPLFCQQTGVYYLFGLITWGSNDCEIGRPAVFSKISAFQSWITNTMNNAERMGHKSIKS